MITARAGLSEVNIGPRKVSFGQVVGRLGWLLAAVSLLAGCASGGGQSAAGGRKDLAGKTYVVTGASSGFGKAVALKLGARGANVVLAARRTALLQEVARTIAAGGGSALVVTADVADAGAVQGLARAAVARYGRVDVWINNAGIGVITRFEMAPVRDYSRLIDVNLKGVVYGSHAAIRQFKAQGGGTLVNIGSIDSEVPLAYQAVYSATKAGVLGLGRALNEELRLYGYARTIKVATVLPWAADTPWWLHAANYTGRTPRMAAMDDPNKVAEIIIRASLHPREEVPAGWKAKSSYVSHKILPDFTESFSANVQHREVQKGAPLPPTSGALHRHGVSLSGVDGGVRQRMRAEDARRRESAGH